MTEEMLRRTGVERVTGLSRSTLYALVASGEFPAPVRIGPRAVAWLASEIQAWIAARTRARDLRKDAA